MSLTSSLLPLSLRHTFRVLARTPGFSATVVGTLAIGIGATAAVFAIVWAVLLRPLPYRDAGRLITVWNYNPANTFGGSRGLGGARVEPLTGVAPPFLDQLRPRLRAIQTIGGLSPSWPVTVSGHGAPEIIDAAYVSDGLTLVLGLQPRLGRDFTALEHAPGGPRVAIVSEPLWRARFANRASLDDATLVVNGESHQIVGVMPRGVALPNTSAEVWLPFALNPFAARTNVPILYLVGVLAPGASLADAQAEVARVSSDVPSELRAMGGERLVAVPLSERLAAQSRRITLVLFASVTLLTLIGCANVSNLLLSRHAARRHEIALRAALGAGRSQVVRQLLLESATLALAGGAAGLIVASLLVESLQRWLAASLPVGVEVGIDGWVIAFSMIASLACTIAFGLAPALQASRTDLVDALRQGGRTTTGGDTRLRAVLIAAEVALALVLLSGAALLARSLFSLTSVHPGFAVDNIVTGGVALPATRYAQPDQRRTFVALLEDRLRVLPGVSSIGMVNRLPLGGAANNVIAAEAEGFASASGTPQPADRRVGTPGYFSAIRVPLVRGRAFRTEDTTGAPPVAIVNEAMAQQSWGGADPIGRRVRIGLASGPGPWLTVVGVIGNVKHQGLDTAARPEIWVPYAQAPVESMVVTLRATTAAPAMIESMRKVLSDLDPDLPLANPRTMEDVVAASVAQPRSRTMLISLIAIVAALLSAIGIGGVVAYAAARMKRDIGVRVALGASSRDVRALVTRRMLVPVGGGAMAGLALSLAASRTLQTFLFEVTPADPIAIGAAMAAVMLLAWIAATVPAWRASAADPSVVLRDS